jgi:hypothetical protein
MSSDDQIFSVVIRWTPPPTPADCNIDIVTSLSSLVVFLFSVCSPKEQLKSVVFSAYLCCPIDSCCVDYDAQKYSWTFLYLTISSTFLLGNTLGYCLLLNDDYYHFPVALQYSLVSTQLYVAWVGVCMVQCSASGVRSTRPIQPYSADCLSNCFN